MFNGKMKAITFSFDDGVTQDIRLIELMNKYGLRGTFNLNSSNLGMVGRLDFVSPEGILVKRDIIERELVADVYKGHEVASHTLHHPILPSLSEEEIIREVEEDRLTLSQIVGYEVQCLAYPGGGVNNDDRVAEIIKQNTGIKFARTITSTGNFEPQENLYRFNPTVNFDSMDKLHELGRQFAELKPNSPQIFYIWGHSYAMDCYKGFWERLEEFFSFISNREDIFYGTNSEVLL